MKKRFSEEQIIQILREAETHGHNLDLCRKYGISEQTFYHWRRRYQGLAVSELQRLKRLESENVKLKRLVAEQALALQTLQEVLQKKGLL
jgi:putative transposase